MNRTKYFYYDNLMHIKCLLIVKEWSVSFMFHLFNVYMIPKLMIVRS